MHIGRLCYWDNNHDPPAPPEPRSIVAARETLLDRLAAAARADSANDWIAGQRVRYLAEAGRVDSALRVAERCAGTAWWCHALRGLAHHLAVDPPAAEEAFDSALAHMAPRDRCRWTDLSWWLDGPLARAYGRAPCGPARDAWEARFHLAAQPLLALGANDLRSELLARRTMSRIRSQGANEYDMAWGEDFAELEARYGWPRAWSAHTASGIAGADARSVVGHEPTPSYTFVPRPDAVTSPTSATLGDWQLDVPRATMRYAPRYASAHLGALDLRVARFRRGDSTLVVAAWSAERDSAWRANALPPDSARAALVVVDSARHARIVRRDSAGRRGALVATVGRGAYLASAELLAPTRGLAARARTGLASLPRDTLVSDLLLLHVAPDASATVERLAGDALASRTITAGAPLGLYWETYFAGDSASAEVSVQATRLDEPWYAKLGRALKLGGGPLSPVAVRFDDAARPGVAARTLALTWPPDATGTYRLDVSVRVGERTATASAVVQVTAPGR